MLRKLIGKIRKKPKEERDRIAFLIALFFSGVVLLLWLYNLPARQAAIEDKHQSNEATDEEKKSAGFSDLFKDIGEQISSLKEAISSSTATTSDSGGKSFEEIITKLSDKENTASSTSQENQFGFTTATSSADSEQREVRIQTIQTATSSETQAVKTD